MPLTSLSRYGILLAACVLLLGLAAPAFTRGAEVGDPRLGAHTLRADGRTLSLARDAGFHWIVQLISWREVETWKGDYFWEYPDAVVRAASFYGLNLIFRVDQQPPWASPGQTNGPPRDLKDYGDFLYALASRYRGKVKAYAVWNEPNLSREWGNQPPDPQAYAAMLKEAYGRLKQADPQALVVSAGLASTNEQSRAALDDRVYLQRLYQAGAGDYFDVLGAHPYGFAYPPEDPRDAHQGLNFQRIQDLRDLMVENGDAGKQIWATEFGWATGINSPKEAWQAVTEEQQAAYLRQAVALARRDWPWLGVMAVWNLSAGLPAQDDGRWYSLIGDDYAPRLPYLALQELGRNTMLRN